MVFPTSLAYLRMSVWERDMALLMDKDKAAYERSGDTQRFLGEPKYATESWDHVQRIIMRAERLSPDPIVVSLPPQQYP